MSYYVGLGGRSSEEELVRARMVEGFCCHTTPNFIPQGACFDDSELNLNKCIFDVL